MRILHTAAWFTRGIPLLFEELFEYSDGELNTVSSGVWTKDSGNDGVVTSQQFARSTPTGGSDAIYEKTVAISIQEENNQRLEFRAKMSPNLTAFGSGAVGAGPGGISPPGSISQQWQISYENGATPPTTRKYFLTLIEGGGTSFKEELTEFSGADLLFDVRVDYQYIESNPNPSGTATAYVNDVLINSDTVDMMDGDIAIRASLNSSASGQNLLDNLRVYGFTS